MRKQPSDLIPSFFDAVQQVFSDKVDMQRPCKRCSGTGEQKPYFSGDTRVCYVCKGRGSFDRPATTLILNLVLSLTKGKVAVRSARPERRPDVHGPRAYFVWRLARFHGGRDVTLPVIADMEVGSDPYKKELDELASVVAKMWFGNDTTGALRWGPLLGACTQSEAADMANRTNAHPLSVQSCGPVVLDHKPIEEFPELR